VTRLLDSPLPVARRQRLAVVAGHLAGLAGGLAFDLRDEGKARPTSRWPCRPPTMPAHPTWPRGRWRPGV
jgi:hypothetical protein